MIGYPITYGENKTLEYCSKTKLMRFYLSPISETVISETVNLETVNLETFNLETFNGLLSTSIIVNAPDLNFGDTFDEFAFRFCDEISKICGTFEPIPDTKTYVIEYDNFCQILSKSEDIVERLATEFEISSQSAAGKAGDFFRDKNVIVEATGVQGKVYQILSGLQMGGTPYYLGRTTQLAKLAQVTGWQVVKADPLFLVTLPTVGGMFLYGCGTLAGNNTVGRFCNTGAELLFLPMRGMEIMWNTYVNPVVQWVFGAPAILNMTQTLKRGPGYSPEEVMLYIRKSAEEENLKGKILEKVSKGLDFASQWVKNLSKKSK